MSSTEGKAYKLPKLVDEVDFSKHEDNPLPENEQAFLRWENVNYFVPAQKPQINTQMMEKMDHIDLLKESKRGEECD